MSAKAWMIAIEIQIAITTTNGQIGHQPNFHRAEGVVGPILFVPSKIIMTFSETGPMSPIPGVKRVFDEITKF